MVGPKPQIANARLSVFYADPGLSAHRCNLDGNWANSGLGDLSTVYSQATGAVLASDAATQAISVLRAMFNASTVFNSYTWYKYAAGAWVPIFSGSSGATGDNAAANTRAGEGTFTFRDHLYNLDKVVLLEGAFGGLVHQAYAGLGTASKSVVDDLLNPASGHMGEWYVSKADSPLANLIFYTQSFNKRIRRKDNLG